jgi:pilus assembly protein FimV
VVLDAGDKTSIMKPGELGTAATQDITADSAAVRAAAAEVPVSPDFTLHAGAPAAQAPTPDITLDDAGKTAVMTDVTAAGPAAGNMIDFSLETPGAAPAKADATVVLSAPPPVAPAAKPDAATTTGSVKPLQPDFKLDLGGETAPAAAAAGAAPAAPAIPDIKLDDISLSLEGAPAAGAAPAGGGAKDDHWNDVQTKFDLAKAYQEMGDKDGAREILQEVIKEGDAGQQAEAKKLLESLG